MPPFASAHSNHISRFAGTPDLSILAENMSLNNNSHSPPSSNSGGQSPEHNHPHCPTSAYNMGDRTASRYAMIDNSAGNQNSGVKSSQKFPMEPRFDKSISQPPLNASPWATNTASNMANATIPATDNNYSAPMSAQFAAVQFAHAMQQATQQPGYQQGHVSFDTVDLPQTIITERSLQNASCYAFYRGDGQYTRLVPLDELPPIPGLPAVGPLNGMIVLPIPRQHQAIKIPQWAAQALQGPLTPNTTPSSGGSMGSGRHFDAFAHGGFSTPGHGTPGNFAGGTTYAARAVSGAMGGGGSRSFNNQTPARREKIYCDKWVHDGVCAFAQQGCKYKHEMPLDIPTQRSLGLFHGLPSWWKREHGLEMKRPSDVGTDGERKLGERRSSSAERHRDAIRETLRAPPSSGLGGGLNSWRLPVQKGSALSQAAPRAGGLFGNIGSRTTSAKTTLSNAYSILDCEDITSPGSNNGGVSVNNNNGGIAASMHATFPPTHNVNGHAKGKADASGNGAHGIFSSKEGK